MEGKDEGRMEVDLVVQNYKIIFKKARRFIA